ncbi:MAG: hypothetical protein HUU10_04425 [Bacteroidetes bacterium]|nr:hypothetical protein [Bacteroidota bacterium]
MIDRQFYRREIHSILSPQQLDQIREVVDSTPMAITLTPRELLNYNTHELVQQIIKEHLEKNKYSPAKKKPRGVNQAIRLKIGLSISGVKHVRRAACRSISDKIKYYEKLNRLITRKQIISLAELNKNLIADQHTSLTFQMIVNYGYEEQHSRLHR